MKRNFYILFLIFFLINVSIANEYIYILTNSELNSLYNEAKRFFYNSEVLVNKEIRGLVLTFEIENVSKEFVQINNKTLKNLEKIEYFLAKFKNPVIIEVHTTKFPLETVEGLKNWEISTVIANKIETILLSRKRISSFCIKSIGYGEFLPSKNTPNNGVKNSGRVDIIILCSINGE